jgi:hypothetical protein
MEEDLINIWNQHIQKPPEGRLMDNDKIDYIKQNFSLFSAMECSLLAEKESGEVVLALAMSDRKFTEDNLESFLNHNDHRISMILVSDSKKYKLTEKMIMMCIDFGIPEVLICHGETLSHKAILKIMKCNYLRAKQFIINHVPLTINMQNKIVFNDHEVFEMLVAKDWYVPSKEIYEKYLNYYHRLGLTNMESHLINRKAGLMEAEKLKKIIKVENKKQNNVMSL